jgi:hypothetical protein
MTQQPETRSTALSETETATLLAIAGSIIPPSAELGVPGASDPAIFADIVRSMGRYGADIYAALHVVDIAAAGSFVALGSERQMAVLTQFRAENPALATSLGAVIARCYYRDDRVMRSIGMEVRAPYPEGYQIEEGDWSLLDPVRKRGKIYRDVDEGRGA